MQKGLRVHAGPDHWNDPDMMEVGNGMSVSEDRAHFSMWSMLAAPLLAGNDLRNMSKETVAILTNREVIAVNQDSLGIQGFQYAAQDSLEIWFKPLFAGEWAVCFLNRSSADHAITFPWKEHVIADSISQQEIKFRQSTFAIRDLWTRKKLGKTNRSFVSQLASHEVKLLKLTPANK